MIETLITVLIGLGAVAVSSFGGLPLVTFLLKHVTQRGQSAGAEESQEEGALRGGVYIGLLERTATTAAILAGQLALIAVIVAIKGLGRFDQLRGNPAASEKFTIGTLCSLLWAAAVGAFGQWLIHLLV